ncbi:MAG: hypothetical protein K8S98_15775 [Planctomycetes bacterium]|nr:hypothetical protein [Planctomycetota bacterium]
MLLTVPALVAATTASTERAGVPKRLADTGLYANFAELQVAADNLPFSPQYPLWSDGATKRRWIHLPPGTAIDASDVDAWRFPIGTKLWKEFAFGRRVETRYMELGANGEWTYATYVWNEDGRDSVLAPERGVRGLLELAPGVRHDIPSVSDCRACHQGAPTAVLGFGALQLSSDRDPSAPHADGAKGGELELDALVRRGLLRGLPDAFVEHAPRIAASNPRERAALGYLHGNCGHCHNARGPLADLGLALDYPLGEARGAPALLTTLGVASKFRSSAHANDVRIAANDPDHSVLARRMASRKPLLQMPPLGTQIADDEGLALVRGWIASDLAPLSSGASMHSPIPDLDPLAKGRRP